MPIFTLARDYLVWHYSRAYVDIVHIWWNYLWLVNHIFSVPDVAMSLLAPFKRIQEKKVNFIAKPEDFFANLFVNLMMRIVGVFIRSALLSVAIIFFVIVFSLGILLLLLWTFLPVMVFHFLITSIRVLFL